MTSELARRTERRTRYNKPLAAIRWERAEEPFEIVTKMEVTHNGRLVPMSLRKVKWLDQADKTIKALDNNKK